jgi:hypothetical protein
MIEFAFLQIGLLLGLVIGYRWGDWKGRLDVAGRWARSDLARNQGIVLDAEDADETRL